MHLVECVEHPDAAWRGATGMAPDFAVAAAVAVGATRACICGPAAMMGASARQLASAALAPEAIHIALERRMHCGVGECGHCYVNHRYVCTDGPVFTLAELRGLTDARLESGLAALASGGGWRRQGPRGSSSGGAADPHAGVDDDRALARREHLDRVEVQLAQLGHHLDERRDARDDGDRAPPGRPAASRGSRRAGGAARSLPIISRASMSVTGGSRNATSRSELDEHAAEPAHEERPEGRRPS